MEPNDLSILIRKLTPSKRYCDELNKEILGNLSKLLRRNNLLYPPFFSLLQDRSKNDSSQVRFLCLQILHFFISRSAHFRQLFAHSYVIDFLKLFYDNLPLPPEFSERISHIFPYALHQWSERFSNLYPQFKIIESFFTNGPTKTEIRNQRQSKKLNFLVDQYVSNYSNFFQEMRYLIDLMDKRNFMFCTDEYKHIIIDALRERRNQLHECTDEIDELVKEALPSTISGEVKEKVSALESEVYAVANEASQIGMDDDEFTDADSAFDSD